MVDEYCKFCMKIKDSAQKIKPYLPLGLSIFNDKKMKKQMFSKEATLEIKRYFHNHISIGKKPNSGDIIPFMPVFQERFPDIECSWRDIRNKLCGITATKRAELKRIKEMSM